MGHSFGFGFGDMRSVLLDSNDRTAAMQLYLVYRCATKSERVCVLVYMALGDAIMLFLGWMDVDDGLGKMVNERLWKSPAEG